MKMHRSIIYYLCLFSICFKTTKVSDFYCMVKKMEIFRKKVNFFRKYFSFFENHSILKTGY